MGKVLCIAKYNCSITRNNIYEPNVCNFLKNCTTKHAAITFKNGVNDKRKNNKKLHKLDIHILFKKRTLN